MTKTISFNIQKGGVAKTTSAVITAEILQQRGYMYCWLILIRSAT